MKISFNKLIRESHLISEGRVEDAKERYPDLPQEVFDIFIKEDPSGNYKYLMAICKMWHDAKSNSPFSYRNKDGTKGLMENVTYFHNQIQKFEKKDINQYDNLREFKREVSKAKENLSKGEIKKGVKKIYEDGNHLVVQPKSHAASCFYGAGTQWCTTMRDYDNYFKNYTSHSSLFYFINKKNGKKRAFLTRLGLPMFGGTIIDPNFESHRGQIYTETDRLGRSMRGIPIEGRKAMSDRHVEKSLEHDPSMETRLRFGKKVLKRIVRGDLNFTYQMGKKPPNSFKKIEGNLYLDTGVVSPNRIKEVMGNVELSTSVEDTGDLESIGGDLIIKSIGLKTLGNIKRIDGDLKGKNYSYDSNLTLDSLGDLKHIGGTLHLTDFPNISIESLKNLNHIGEIKVSDEKFEELFSNVKLPNLPNTPLNIV